MNLSGTMPNKYTYLCVCMNHLPASSLQRIVVLSWWVMFFGVTLGICSVRVAFLSVWLHICDVLRALRNALECLKTVSSFFLILKSCCLCMSGTAPPTLSGFVKTSLTFSGGVSSKKHLIGFSSGGQEIKIEQKQIAFSCVLGFFYIFYIFH